MGQQVMVDFTSMQQDMLALLFELVRLESPSRDKESLDRLGLLLRGSPTRSCGAAVEIVPNEQGGRPRTQSISGDIRFLRPALVLGHFDVLCPWPQGTLEPDADSVG